MRGHLFAAEMIAPRPARERRAGLAHHSRFHDACEARVEARWRHRLSLTTGASAPNDLAENFTVWMVVQGGSRNEAMLLVLGGLALDRLPVAPVEVAEFHIFATGSSGTRAGPSATRRQTGRALRAPWFQRKRASAAPPLVWWTRPFAYALPDLGRLRPARTKERLWTLAPSTSTSSASPATSSQAG